MASNVCWKRYWKHNLPAFLGSKPAFAAPNLMVEDLWLRRTALTYNLWRDRISYRHAASGSVWSKLDWPIVVSLVALLLDYGPCALSRSSPHWFVWLALCWAVILVTRTPVHQHHGSMCPPKTPLLSNQVSTFNSAVLQWALSYNMSTWAHTVWQNWSAINHLDSQTQAVTHQ